MPAEYIYTHATGSNVDLSAQVRAYRTTMSASAEQGSVSISNVIVDDPDGGLDIIGHRPFNWRETSEGSNTITILGGFIADRTIDRGPFRVTNQRQWTVNVSDANALLHRGIMRGSDASRPAETDVARMQWLMSTGEMVLVPDSTYLSTASPVQMDANDYRNQTVFQIVDDCAQQSGKNYFLFRNEYASPPNVGIFYDYNSSAAYSSTIRLTNVYADVDNTTTFAIINEESSMNRDPSRVVSNVLVPYQGGDAWVSNDATRIQFARRDTTAPAINVHSAAKATARGIRYLSDNSTEEDRLTLSYFVPLNTVNHLQVGQTFQAKISHFPNYTDWTWLRVLKRTVMAWSEMFYKVTVECTTGSGTSAPSGTCAASLSTAAGNVTETAIIPAASSLGITPATPTTTPSVIVIGHWSRNHTGGYGIAPSANTSMTGATNGDNTRTDYTGAFSSYGSWGYQTSAAAVTCATTGSSIGNWFYGRAVSVAFPTSSTSPVQIGKQSGSGGNATMPSAPTVGNILVCVAIVEGTDASGLSIVTSNGWTVIAASDIYAGTNSKMACGIFMKCATAGMTTSIPIWDWTFSHWQFVSEWRP